MTLPPVVGLCPDPAHTEEFYVPHAGRCPEPGCTRELAIYKLEVGDMNGTEETEGTWTITVQGGTALWSNIQSALRSALRGMTVGGPGHHALKALYEGKAEFEGRMPGLIPERPSEGKGREGPRWEDGALLVHVDELEEMAGSLPPHVEMRVGTILRSVKTSDPAGLKRPGFMVALALGDEAYNVSRDDQIHIAELLEVRGWDITPPRRAPDGSPVQDPRPEAERTAPDRYIAAQEAREASAGVAQTEQGRRAATYVELGDLKTIARDKGWDLAFEWIVEHQERDEKSIRAVDEGLAAKMDTEEQNVIELIASALPSPELVGDFRTLIGFLRSRSAGLEMERARVNQEARDRAARRVLNVLWRDFSSEIVDVPFGRVMLTCADVVTEVLDHDYDPLVPTP